MEIWSKRRAVGKSSKSCGLVSFSLVLDFPRRQAQEGDGDVCSDELGRVGFADVRSVHVGHDERRRGPRALSPHGRTARVDGARVLLPVRDAVSPRDAAQLDPKGQSGAESALGLLGLPRALRHAAPLRQDSSQRSGHGAAVRRGSSQAPRSGETPVPANGLHTHSISSPRRRSWRPQSRK